MNIITAREVIARLNSLKESIDKHIEESKIGSKELHKLDFELRDLARDVERKEAFERKNKCVDDLALEYYGRYEDPLEAEYQLCRAAGGV